MKHGLLIIILFFPAVGIYPQEHAITRDHLVKNTWGDFTFTADGKIMNGGAYGGYIQGTYSIKDDIVSIVFTSGNHLALNELKNRKINYRLIVLNNEEYPERLVTDNPKEDFGLINYTMRAKENTILHIPPDIDLVILNRLTARTTSNVKVRDYPGLDGNVYTITYNTDPFKPQELEYYKTNSLVQIHGRTRNKYKVGGYNNYWYAVDLIYITEADLVELSPRSAKPRTGYYWIYGEFLDFNTK